MSLDERHSLLRVFLPETARFDDRPAWRAVVEHLRLAGFTGATAYRGAAGFTGNGFATDRIEVQAAGFPVVVEAVDVPPKVDRVLDDIRAILPDRGLVTVERVEARTYRRAG